MRKMLVRASRRSIARPDRMARRTSALPWWQRRKPRRREWSGILSSMLKPQNQRYARLTLTSRQSNRSDRKPKACRGSASGSSEPDRSRGGRASDNAAKARHRPTTDRAQMQSHVPSDRPAPPLQGRTNKTAALDPAPTAPSWPDPAADPINVRESLFAAAFNGLLQQNLPTSDSCGGLLLIVFRP